MEMTPSERQEMKGSCSSEDVVSEAAWRGSFERFLLGSSWDGGEVPCLDGSGGETLILSDVLVLGEGCRGSVSVLFPVGHARLVRGVRGSGVTLIANSVRNTSPGLFGRSEIEH